MLPLFDVQSRADVVLIVSLLKGIRSRAIDLVAAIDDMVGRIDREPPVGWVPGEEPPKTAGERMKAALDDLRRLREQPGANP